MAEKGLVSSLILIQGEIIQSCEKKESDRRDTQLSIWTNIQFRGHIPESDVIS